MARLLPGGTWLAEAASGHHERLDGTGYPDGLRDTRIAPLTRLLAVCDVYAALSVPRPHRAAASARRPWLTRRSLAERGPRHRTQAERSLRALVLSDRIGGGAGRWSNRGGHCGPSDA